MCHKFMIHPLFILIIFFLSDYAEFTEPSCSTDYSRNFTDYLLIFTDLTLRSLG